MFPLLCVVLDTPPVASTGWKEVEVQQSYGHGSDRSCRSRASVRGQGTLRSNPRYSKFCKIRFRRLVHSAKVYGLSVEDGETHFSRSGLPVLW